MPILARVFESSILVSQSHIKWKDCQVDPIGFASLFPSGDKGFRGFKKGRSSLVFLKVRFWFLNHILSGKTVKWTPFGSLRSSLRGIKFLEKVFFSLLVRFQKNPT